MPKPKYLDCGVLSEIAAHISGVTQMLPEPEQAPGRSEETESDLTQWKLEELAEELFARFAAKTSPQVRLHGLGQKVFSPLAPEDAEKVMPLLNEIGRRCGEYLKNPEYSFEKRPFLNSYLRQYELLARMGNSGIDFAKALGTIGMAGEYATKTLMDLVIPKTDGLSPEDRKQKLDEIEETAKKGPFFSLIQSGLDHMNSIGEYQIALQDTEHPLTAEKKAELESRIDKQLDDLVPKVDEAQKALQSQDFRLEDHPYMNKQTVENLLLGRGLAAAKERAEQEKALLANGLHPEDYLAVYGIGLATDHILGDATKGSVVTDPEHQTRADLAGWMLMLRSADSIKNAAADPEAFKKLKEELQGKGIRLQAYAQALQEQLLAGAGEFEKDETLTQAERDFFKYAQKELDGRDYYDKTVTDEELVQAAEFVETGAGKTAREIRDKQDASPDFRLRKELDEAGYGMPPSLSAAEDVASPLTIRDVTNLIGPSEKLEGVFGDKKAASAYNNGKFTALVSLANEGESPTFVYNGTTSHTFKEVAEIEQMDGSKTLSHPKAEMTEMLRSMNKDAREAKKRVPVSNRAQHTMLNYVESLSRGALERNIYPEHRGKDAWLSYANSLWANITEPGVGKNVSWSELERLNDKYGLVDHMQDSLSLHEIFRQSQERSQVGWAEPAVEAKERELYRKLLEKVITGADKILQIPEEQRAEMTGFFDQTNAGNSAMDIFGARGLSIGKTLAEEHLEALDKGWPIHELSSYIGLKNELQYIRKGLEKNNLVPGERMQQSLEAIEEALRTDISGQSDKEKAGYFARLSAELARLNEERKKIEDDFKRQVKAQEERIQKEIPEEAREDPNKQTEEHKALLKRRDDLSSAESDFAATQTTPGSGVGVKIDVDLLSDALLEAGRGSMKRAMFKGQAVPEEVDALQPPRIKMITEDYENKAKRIREASERIDQSKAIYGRMLADLKKLKIKGHEDSEYFKEMERVLDAIGSVGTGDTPKRLETAYQRLAEVAQDYYDHRSGAHIFSAWRQNGKDRRDLAEKIAKQAREDLEKITALMKEKESRPSPEFTENKMGYLVGTVRDEILGVVNPNEPISSQLRSCEAMVEKESAIPSWESLIRTIRTEEQARHFRDAIRNYSIEAVNRWTENKKQQIRADFEIHPEEYIDEKTQAPYTREKLESKLDTMLSDYQPAKLFSLEEQEFYSLHASVIMQTAMLGMCFDGVGLGANFTDGYLNARGRADMEEILIPALKNATVSPTTENIAKELKMVAVEALDSSRWLKPEAPEKQKDAENELPGQDMPKEAGPEKDKQEAPKEAGPDKDKQEVPKEAGPEKEKQEPEKKDVRQRVEGGLKGLSAKESAEAGKKESKPDYSKLRQEQREKEKAVQGPVKVQDQKGGKKK